VAVKTAQKGQGRQSLGQSLCQTLGYLLGEVAKTGASLPATR